jgi:GNAT superfamily N-acetyltransferase
VSPLDVRPARTADIDAVSATLALGFADDPVWGTWAFPDVPDRGRRVDRLRAFWRPFVAAAVAYEGLLTAPGCSAVALWVPPGVDEVDPANAAVAAEVVAEVCGDRAPLVEAGFAAFEDSKPAGEYWYLSLLATHPDHRGQGLGMALVGDQLARLDAQGAASYLESTNPVNLRRYERAGFVLHGAFDLPHGPTVDTMWRDPRLPA